MTTKKLRAVNPYDPEWTGPLCTRGLEPVDLRIKDGLGIYPAAGYAGGTLREWRHKKRGTLYEVQGYATLQCEGPHDGARCVCYIDLTNGKMWVRPESEFLDGRFERVS